MAFIEIANDKQALAAGQIKHQQMDTESRERERRRHRRTYRPFQLIYINLLCSGNLFIYFIIQCAFPLPDISLHLFLWPIFLFLTIFCSSYFTKLILLLNGLLAVVSRLADGQEMSNRMNTSPKNTLFKNKHWLFRVSIPGNIYLVSIFNFQLQFILSSIGHYHHHHCHRHLQHRHY